MSVGGLCGAKIKISTEINREGNTMVDCDLYGNHDGPHSKMFYHYKRRPDGIIDNYRLGRITWDDKIIKP